MSGKITVKRYAILVSLLSMAALSSCSVDTAPQNSPPPEPDVRQYYIQLAAPRMEYQYAVSSVGSAYHPGNGQLTMDMKGQEDNVNGTPVYGCMWSYNNFGTPTMWYYSLNDKQAIDLGIEFSGMYNDHWVDLQSPLSKGANWTFQSKGETVTANVLQYGVSAQVEGQSYSDVIMVQYTGGSGTTGTQWFARGKGLIFSHIERPGDGMVENRLMSIQQK